MAEPISLNSERAKRDEDATKWAPLEALKEAVHLVEAGAIDPEMVYIAFVETKDDTLTYPGIAAGVDQLQLIGLLQSHIWDLQHYNSEDK